MLWDREPTIDGEFDFCPLCLYLKNLRVRDSRSRPIFHDPASPNGISIFYLTKRSTPGYTHHGCRTAASPHRTWPGTVPAELPSCRYPELAVTHYHHRSGTCRSWGPYRPSPEVTESYSTRSSMAGQQTSANPRTTAATSPKPPKTRARRHRPRNTGRDLLYRGKLGSIAVVSRNSFFKRHRRLRRATSRWHEPPCDGRTANEQPPVSHYCK